MAEIKTYSANNAQIFIGSSANMEQIADNSVNLIITSPPYWTLKDYDVEGQIGTGSNSYDYYISELNKVWKECVRVLAPDGKICINIMPFLLTGKAARFDRRETRIVLGDIEKFIAAGKIDASKDITVDSLMSAKIINRKLDGLKVLAKGEIKSAVNVVADKWSKAAEAAIVKAGGTIKNN